MIAHTKLETMIPIRIVKTISLINDRVAANKFERLTHPYFKMLESLTTTGASSEVLRRIYIMVVFDPAVPHGASGLEFDKYSRKNQEAEATIDVPREVAAPLNENQLLAWVATRLLHALCLVRDRIPGAHLEIQELICGIDLFNRSNIPDYTPFNETATQTFSQHEGPNDTQAPLDSKFVVQLNEGFFCESGEVDRLEKEISIALKGHGELEGHDVGGGKFNIFIAGRHTSIVLELLRRVLSRNQLLTEARIAVEVAGTDDYRMLWPPDVTDRFSL